jgi:hypothetical protein
MLILTECDHTAMFSSYSHPNLRTFLPNVSRTPAIFPIIVSWAGAMFLSRAADVLESLHLGRPRKEPKRVVDPHLRYAQVDKRRVGGRVVEVKRHILFGSADDIIQILATDRCGTQINTSYVERDNVTSRHSNGRLVRKTLSHSKKKAYLQRHIDLEDASYNFVRPHSALKVKLRHPAAHGRLWQQRTPAMAAGLTDHIWSLEELLSYCLPPPRG